MTTTEHPITRSELRQELEHYATKEDLAKLETRLIKWIVRTDDSCDCSCICGGGGDSASPRLKLLRHPTLRPYLD